MLVKIVMPEYFRKFPSEIKKNKIKAGIVIGLSAYWCVIILGTLIQFK